MPSIVRAVPAILLALLLLGAGAANAAPIITMTSNNLVVNAQDGLGGSDSDAYTGLGLNTFGELEAQAGDSYGYTAYVFEGTSSYQTMEFEFDHQASEQDDAQVTTIDSFLDFTADAALTYDIEGYYESEIDATTGIRLVLQLIDMTTASTLYDSDQLSYNTVNQSFILGEEDGDTSNTLTGSASGNLVAGHDYRLYFGAGILSQNPSHAEGYASGGIYVNLATAVPAPASLALVLLGLAGLVLARYRLH